MGAGLAATLPLLLAVVARSCAARRARPHGLVAPLPGVGRGLRQPLLRVSAVGAVALALPLLRRRRLLAIGLVEALLGGADGVRRPLLRLGAVLADLLQVHRLALASPFLLALSGGLLPGLLLLRRHCGELAGRRRRRGSSRECLVAVLGWTQDWLDVVV